MTPLRMGGPSRSSRIGALATVGAALLAVTGSAVSAERSARLVLEVPRDADVVISGPRLSPAAAGFPQAASVAAVGDVNGDGRADLAVASQQQHHGGETRSFVLFGGRLPKSLALPASRSRGFEIRGSFVVPAGDVNGDGRDDLVRCPAGNQAKPAEATILLGRPGTRAAADRGFHVVGADCGRGIGDLDGDGLDDLLFTPRSTETWAAIVYGSRKPDVVRLDHLGDRGYRIVASRSASVGVWAAGDVNDDGRADLLAGRSPDRYASGRGRWMRLLLGRPRVGTLDLDAASTRTLPSIACGGNLLQTVGPVGDFNGDGVGDVAVTVAPASLSDRLYVLLGRRGTWPHESPCGGSRSIEIKLGHWVKAFQPGGDLDGDGYEDLLVSSDESYRTPDYTYGGAVYVVYGRGGTAKVVDLARDNRVLRIRLDSSQGGATIGSSIAAPGDVTGDGRPDVAIAEESSGTTFMVSRALP